MDSNKREEFKTKAREALKKYGSIRGEYVIFENISVDCAKISGCCAVGAFALHNLGLPEEVKTCANINSSIMYDFHYSDSYIAGVISGFDGESYFGNAGDFKDGYNDGQQLWYEFELSRESL